MKLLFENIEIINKAKITALNRTVTASPPYDGSGYKKPCSGLRPLHGFVPPHLGQKSLLRNALLFALNISCHQNVKKNTKSNISVKLCKVATSLVDKIFFIS
jgi:hypothetical protein